MRNSWKLSKNLLNILGAIYERFEFDGMMLNKRFEEDMTDLKNIDGLEEILVDTEGGKRVHPVLEAAFLTVTDASGRMRISIDTEEMSVSVSMRGNSIAVTERTNDAIEITWVPFITLAVGAACKFVHDQLTNGALILVKEENGVILQGILSRYPYESDVYTLDWTDCPGRSDQEDAFQEKMSGVETEELINRALVEVYSRCLRGGDE